MNESICPNCSRSFLRKGTRVYCSLFCAVWSRVEKRGPDECWPWTGSRLEPSGYGVFRFDGEYWRAARAVLKLQGHSIDGLDALHSCDNPPCCNPRHVSPGTHTDNMQQMVARSRRRPQNGENAPRASIARGVALEIKRRLAAKERQVDIALALNVKRSLVADISAGRAWKELEYVAVSQ